MNAVLDHDSRNQEKLLSEHLLLHILGKEVVRGCYYLETFVLSAIDQFFKLILPAGHKIRVLRPRREGNPNIIECLERMAHNVTVRSLVTTS